MVFHRLPRQSSSSGPAPTMGQRDSGRQSTADLSGVSLVRTGPTSTHRCEKGRAACPVEIRSRNFWPVAAASGARPRCHGRCPVSAHRALTVMPRRQEQALPRLTVVSILTWADDHHERTGRWPRGRSAPVPGQPGETWAAIDNALQMSASCIVMTGEGRISAPVLESAAANLATVLNLIHNNLNKLGAELFWRLTCKKPHKRRNRRAIRPRVPPISQRRSSTSLSKDCATRDLRCRRLGDPVLGHRR
jgi:hypothetical protein